MTSKKQIKTWLMLKREWAGLCFFVGKVRQ